MEFNIKKTGLVHTGFTAVTNLKIEKDNIISGVLLEDGGSRPRASWTLTGEPLLGTINSLDMDNIEITIIIESKEVPLILDKETVDAKVGERQFGATIHWFDIDDEFSAVEFGCSTHPVLVTNKSIAKEVFYAHLPY